MNSFSSYFEGQSRLQLNGNAMWVTCINPEMTSFIVHFLYQACFRITLLVFGNVNTVLLITQNPLQPKSLILTRVQPNLKATWS